MADEELRGKGDNLLGRGQQAAGTVLGDKRLERRGFFRRMIGAFRERLGRAGRRTEQR